MRSTESVTAMDFFVMGKKLGTLSELFGTERIDRLELRRLVRGQKPEYDPYRHGTAERKDDGRSGDVGGEGEKRRESDQSEAERDPDGSTEEREDDRFRQELHDDVGIERTDGASDADFASAFRNRYEHDVHDSDASDDERYRGDAGEEYLEGSGDARDGGEHVGGTRYREVRL